MITTTQLGVDTQVMIFKTNIQDENDIRRTELVLNSHYSILRWTVDLQDWEKVLKVEASMNCSYHEVQKLINNLGYHCSELKH